MQIARWNERDEEQEKNSIVDDASIALILPALDYIGENYKRDSFELRSWQRYVISAKHICAVFFRNPCG